MEAQGQIFKQFLLSRIPRGLLNESSEKKLDTIKRILDEWDQDRLQNLATRLRQTVSVLKPILDSLPPDEEITKLTLSLCKMMGHMEQNSSFIPMTLENREILLDMKKNVTKLMHDFVDWSSG